jgi:hypothetical protein
MSVCDWAFAGHEASYENVVIRKPVNPNDAVQAGKRQEAMFTTRMIAKQSQKDNPMLPPTIPVDKVATAILALNLGKISAYWIFLQTGQSSYQKVQAFQTCVVLLSLSSSVTLSIPPASTDSFFAQPFKPLRIVPFSMDAESVLSKYLSAESCCLISILNSVVLPT